MSCCGDPIEISYCAPWANLHDVKALMGKALGCCKGAVSNAMNPVATPAAAVLEAFPNGLSACACDVLWLTAPDGSAWGSWDNGVSFKLMATPSITPVTNMGAALYQGNPGNLPVSGGTAISFDVVQRDTSGFFNIANPTRLTIPVDGAYMILGNISFNIAADSVARHIYLSLNGTPGPYEPTGDMKVSNNITYGITLQVFHIGYLNAGDYVRLMGYNASGSIVQSMFRAYFKIERIGT